MKFTRFSLLVVAAAMAQAQTWDTSGNNLLNGKYYFRQVYYLIGDQYGDLSRAIAAYGNITFDGAGHYTISGGVYVDSSVGEAALTGSGTYSIAASGYGFISSPYVTGDVVYGLVSNQGIFVGSSTETTYGYNDMMIAAPEASPAPTAASFTGSWVCAGLDLTSLGEGNPSYALSYIMPLSPNGTTSLGSGIVSGYLGGNGTTVTTQNFSATYSFSNGAAVASFPNNGTLVAGQKYFYFSKDGNFLFGGAPNSFDMIVGVKTGTSLPTVSGLYYQAGIDDYEGQLDTYYGSEYVIAGAAPQTILGHQRVNFFGDISGYGSLYDSTYSGTFSLIGNGTFTSTAERLIVGDGGAVGIISGVGPSLGISVVLQAPTLSGSGVFVDPTRVQNSASDAPFTAGIAPGELLTLYGSGLASAVTVAGIPFPTTGLGGVQVTIGGLPAAIYYVSPTQISAIVPYGVTVGSAVQIQVTNNGALSNIVWAYVGATAPGVFTQNQNGTGFGEIEHLGIGNSVAPAGTVVTTASPAVIGETLAVYLTGLGTVSPAISDGSPGPASLSSATNTISVDFSGTAAAAPSFAGLAPGFSGLYQLNVTVPTGLTAGANFLDIAGPDSYMSYALVPIALTATTSTAASAEVKTAPEAAPIRANPKLRQVVIKATPRVPGGGK